MESTLAHEPMIRVVLLVPDEVGAIFNKYAEDFETKTSKILSRRHRLPGIPDDNNRKLLIALGAIRESLSDNKRIPAEFNPKPWCNNYSNTNASIDKKHKNVKIDGGGREMLSLTHTVAAYCLSLIDQYKNVDTSNVPGYLLQIYLRCIDLSCNACLKMNSRMDIEYLRDHDTSFVGVSSTDIHKYSMDISITMVGYIETKNNQLIALVGSNIAQKHGLQRICDSISQSLQRLLNSVNEYATCYGIEECDSISRFVKEAKDKYVSLTEHYKEACNQKLEKQNVSKQEERTITDLKGELEELHSEVFATFNSTLERCDKIKISLKNAEKCQLSSCTVHEVEEFCDLNQRQSRVAIGQ